tara:strand:+ start:13571 stop:14344 length:774 start_codon:yes stop_codon:yes gene_type:complete
MKLKDIYKKIDSLNEAVNMSISMSGETADDVATLMKMVKDAGGKPEVMQDLPKLSPRDDIEKSLKVMDLPPMPPKGMDDMEPGCEDEVAEKEGEWDNSPDEQHQDTAYMQNDLAGGLNRQKKSYPKVAGGDNPMALEDEIKAELAAKLSEVMKEGKDKMPSKAEVMKCCKDGMSVAEICKKYPDCDQDKLKALCKECKDEMKESVNEGEGKEMALPSGKEIKKCADDGMSKAEIVKKYTEMGCNEQKVKKLYDAHCG